MDNTVKIADKFAFIKKPRVWGSAVGVIALIILVSTYGSWHKPLTGTNKNSLSGAALSLTESYSNPALGLSLLYPSDWTIPVDSAQNGVMLLQSADKQLSVEFIKGVCYKASDLVTCSHNFQITLGMPQDDANATADEALLNSIVASAQFEQ